MPENKTIKYKTEDQVKKALKIEDLNDMPEEKIKEFTVMIPNMDYNLAQSIISQFPDFAHYGKSIVSECRKLCDLVLMHNGVGLEGTIKGYQTILDSLSKRMEVPDITEDEVQSITKDMIEVADKIAEVYKQNQGFLKEVIGQVAKVLGIAGSIILVSFLAYNSTNDSDDQNDQNGQNNQKEDNDSAA